MGRFARTERIATAATVMVSGVAVRVYSLHLATKIEEGPGARRDQARAILADAAGYERVVLSGDLNSHGVGRDIQAAGYLWPTEHNPHTLRFGNWDHVFVRGLAMSASTSTGVVHDNRHASDHRPVWAVVSLPPVAR